MQCYVIKYWSMCLTLMNFLQKFNGCCGLEGNCC